MRTMAAVAALAAAAVSCWCSSAQAYRPFDGTDAAVADTGEVEIEFGPVEYQREGAESALLAPDLRVNYGFTPDWEATIEGDLTHALSPDIPATTLIGNIASLKRSCVKAACRRSRGPASQPNSTCCCPGFVTSPAPGSVLSVSSRNSGTGRQCISMSMRR